MQSRTRNFGLFAALIAYGYAEYIYTLARKFYPAPKVYSSVLKISFKDHSYNAMELKIFADFVRVLFSNRRKTLSNVFKINNLDMKILEILNISATKRAEELDWDSILKIGDHLSGGRK